ncbi:hypothetical protein [Pseudomonas sp. CBC3]|uniref:hypothetical protein n=1 Tax=Pseudomonas sp. CBC3 TaxID=3123318 RepID=UPI0030E7EF84
MITEDFELVKDIFALVDEGIVSGYDAFRLEIEVNDDYIVEELTVEKNSVEVTNAETDYNGAVLYELVEKLRASAKARGENWSAFVISYRHGEQVHTKFKY